MLCNNCKKNETQQLHTCPFNTYPYIKVPLKIPPLCDCCDRCRDTCYAGTRADRHLYEDVTMTIPKEPLLSNVVIESPKDIDTLPEG